MSTPEARAKVLNHVIHNLTLLRSGGDIETALAAAELERELSSRQKSLSHPLASARRRKPVAKTNG